MNRYKQAEKLLDYLKSRKSASTMDIMRDLHISSPTKIISDLRKVGHPIEDEWISGKDKDGFYVRFKKYHMC